MTVSFEILDITRLFIEEQVIVSEVWPGDMPGEVFCLQVESEHVREQNVQPGGDASRSFLSKITRRAKRRVPPLLFAFLSHRWDRNSRVGELTCYRVSTVDLRRMGH